MNSCRAASRIERIGAQRPPGLIAHLAWRTDAGLRYVEVWQSEEDWKAFEHDRVHPAVHPLLQDMLGFVPPEPPAPPSTSSTPGPPSTPRPEPHPAATRPGRNQAASGKPARSATRRHSAALLVAGAIAAWAHAADTDGPAGSPGECGRLGRRHRPLWIPLNLSRTEGGASRHPKE